MLKHLHPESKGIIVTEGETGARLVTLDRSIHIKIPDKIEGVVNTVGCGDALLAGFVAGLSEHQSLTEAFRQGVASAVANLLSDEPGRFSDKHRSTATAKLIVTDQAIRFDR